MTRLPLGWAWVGLVAAAMSAGCLLPKLRVQDKESQASPQQPDDDAGKAAGEPNAQAGQAGTSERSGEAGEGGSVGKAGDRDPQGRQGGSGEGRSARGERDAPGGGAAAQDLGTASEPERERADGGTVDSGPDLSTGDKMNVCTSSNCKAEPDPTNPECAALNQCCDTLEDNAAKQDCGRVQMAHDSAVCQAATLAYCPNNEPQMPNEPSQACTELLGCCEEVRNLSDRAVCQAFAGTEDPMVCEQERGRFCVTGQQM